MVELKPTSGGKHKGSKSIYDQYKTLDDAYFSGVVVTHGSPRQHIWTFAAGAVENFTSYLYFNMCQCDTKYNIPIPPFVGENYFCESGYIRSNYYDDGSHYTVRDWASPQSLCDLCLWL